MSSLLRALTLALFLLPLAACGGEETNDDNGAANGAAEATEAAGDAATAAGEAVADAVCCKGNCDAPAGYCCADDGTCNDTHPKLKLQSTL